MDVAICGFASPCICALLGSLTGNCSQAKLERRRVRQPLPDLARACCLLCLHAQAT